MFPEVLVSMFNPTNARLLALRACARMRVWASTGRAE